MKIWFDYCDLNSYFTDTDVKLGIGWYKHHPSNKWRGLTVHFYALNWMVSLNYVNDYKAYKKRMDFRYSDYLKKKQENRKKDQ